MKLLRDGLGSVWRNTVVVMVSEFGRTVEVNGTGGTDHGTAGALLIAGGSAHTEPMMSEWPGLEKKNLFQQRDIRPVANICAVLGREISTHLMIQNRIIDSTLFPTQRQSS